MHTDVHTEAYATKYNVCTVQFAYFLHVSLGAVQGFLPLCATA
jgi:hypothetical protein